MKRKADRYSDQWNYTPPFRAEDYWVLDRKRQAVAQFRRGDCIGGRPATEVVADALNNYFGTNTRHIE